MLGNPRRLAILIILPIAIAASALTAYGAEKTSGQAQETIQRASPKEQVIYTDLNDTYLALKAYYPPDDGSDYYAYSRIDVVDETGRACQARVYLCRGSERYTRNFREYLSALEDAYSHCDTEIAGYLDLWWDNRIRNWIPGNFFAVESAAITDPDGYTHDVTVVAVCGSEAFMEQDSALRARYLKGYGRLF